MDKEIHFEVKFTMWGGFRAKKLNSRKELQLDYAQNQAEPESQAELVPGPDLDKI